MGETGERLAAKKGTSEINYCLSKHPLSGLNVDLGYPSKSVDTSVASKGGIDETPFQIVLFPSSLKFLFNAV